ncbi:g5867 [Coccomyxa viridis]|uniref:G5867 protein n=1 Tax=Coccomyxa viridis TaxID=1274662 RepID=A0ABP1FYW1_9CHLO
METEKRRGLLQLLSGVEEKLAFPKQQARLHELAQRKSRILNVQNGSRRGVDVSKAVVLHEGSLRTLWAEKAQKNVEAKQVAPEGAVRAEALKWENKRLAEAKAKLEAQLRDQSRRMSQMEDTLAELRNCTSKHSAPSRGPHSSFKVRPGSMDVEKVHEALSAALVDRDAARQMCQEVRAMLAQSEALRKADPDRKVQLLQTETIHLRTALTRMRAEAMTYQQDIKKLQMERNLARHTLQEVKQSVAADVMASSQTLQELRATMLRDKSATESRMAELDAKCLSYSLALQRADHQQASDKGMIASLSQSCSKLRAEVKSLAVENSGMHTRMQSVLEAQKRRALEAVRAAEHSRARMLREKAAAEHDLVQVTAARDLLEQQLRETQASLASSKAAAPPSQAPAAVTASPFAQCSGIPHELQTLCAELKTENARLHAEVAELRSTSANDGLPSSHAFSGVDVLLEPHGDAISPLNSPDQAQKGTACANAPRTPPTGSTDAQSRSVAREDSPADSSAHRTPATLDCSVNNTPANADAHRRRSVSAHALVFEDANPARARLPITEYYNGLDDTTQPEHETPFVNGWAGSMERPRTARRLASLSCDSESSERLFTARSRAGSTASTIYTDAHSDAGSEASLELTPAKSGALAQMQEKLAAAHEKLEQVELEKADAARLAALRGRAADAQSAALRAAEAALAKKRRALAEALKAREAAEAALAHSQAKLQDDDSKVHDMANELEAALDEAQKEKQILLDANAALQDELSSLREKQKSAELKPGELQAEMVQNNSESNEAIEAYEHTVAELTAERQAAEEDAEKARQALAAAQMQLGQLQGEQAAMALEREWALESSGALQARIDELLQERKTQSPSAVLSLEAELEHTRSALSQAERDAARAQEEAAQLKHQLREPLQALPNDPFNMGAWLSKKFERTKSGRSSANVARSLHDASTKAAERL